MSATILVNGIRRRAADGVHINHNAGLTRTCKVCKNTINDYKYICDTKNAEKGYPNSVLHAGCAVQIGLLK